MMVRMDSSRLFCPPLAGVADEGGRGWI